MDNRSGMSTHDLQTELTNDLRTQMDIVATPKGLGSGTEKKFCSKYSNSRCP